MLVALLALSVFAGCTTTTPNASPSGTAESTFDTSEEIAVISREEGSGTRGAFIELMGIETDDGDQTTEEAIISNGTSVVLTTVAQTPYAIGYISLGSLNDTVKALKVDGVEATADNIKAGTYAVARPFNIATKGEPEGLALDFINFIMSDEGQAIADEEGYISVSSGAFTSTKPKGQIAVGGSTSVHPLMEKLAEAYKVHNPDAVIDIHASGSSAGMTGAIDGSYDIGMASRELKDSEKAELTNVVIAQDGIAVIVNLENTLDDITSEKIRQIYVGEILTWDEL